jgi:hypothetical protein
VTFLGHRDGVVENGLDLRRGIARQIRRYRPEVLVTATYELWMRRTSLAPLVDANVHVRGAVVKYLTWRTAAGRAVPAAAAGDRHLAQPRLRRRSCGMGVTGGSMTAIPDLELAVRIGARDQGAAEAIRRFTLEAGRRHALDHEDVLRLARGLHWLAVGHRPDASAADMVASLLLIPAPRETCALIAAAVDEVYALTATERRTARPPDSPELDSWMLGWRLTMALELVQGEELDMAAQRERESAP